MNRLYYGDCLAVMSDMDAASVDLIYLDPPFNSNRSYNAIYKDSTGRDLPEQVEAFCDVWELTEERERSIAELPVLLRAHGVDDSAAQLWQLWMSALRHTQPRLLAYLSYMTERLLIMKGLLKPTGSIYLHCDPTASHYIKIVMDAIFGYRNFGNEIIWCYRGGGVPRRHFARKHDVILRYCSNIKAPLFNVDAVRIPYSESVSASPVSRYDKSYRTNKVYQGYRPNKKGKHPEDWWVIQPLMPSDKKERLGYPTQKPLALLRRVILASSNEGDLVLDPFCGCATTIAAAHELNRRWVGIDIAYHAITRVVRARLLDVYGLHEDKDYQISGIPLTKEAAIAVWERDAYQFQRWAVERVDGFVTTRRGHDGGIDGRIFFDKGNKQKGSMILEVKGGAQVGIGAVRDLRGAMARDGCELAGLIIRDQPGVARRRNFQREMGAAGFIAIGTEKRKYARMQLLTIDDLIAGRGFDTPVAEGRGRRQKKLAL